jgi:hypothetical protein
LIYTPQPESLFIIVPEFDISKIDRLRRHKNLLFIASLDEPTYVGSYVRNMLDTASRELVMRDSAFLFIKKDVWANGQILMVLTAKDRETLVKRIIENRSDIYIYFRDEFFQRELDYIYSEGFNKVEIENSFWDRYGWKILVQHDYFVAIDSAEERFVWLRRMTPRDMERWIFIHWIDSVYNPERFMTQGWIVKRRNEITRKFYRTIGDDAYVIIADDPESIKYLYFFPVNFNGRYAVRVQGLWRFNDFSGGGPFVSYIFYDEEQKRLYFIDGSIFAPRYEKKKLVIQVDALLHTFRTKSEVKTNAEVAQR